MEDHELKEAYRNWQKSKIHEYEANKAFIELLFIKLEIYNMTELEAITGIKRPTLYYYMYGKEGKHGRVA